MSDDIVTPCCGAELIILTEPDGRSYNLSSDVPSEIMCADEKCYNTWTPKGKADER